jgi:hypothetical protein
MRSRLRSEAAVAWEPPCYVSVQVSCNGSYCITKLPHCRSSRFRVDNNGSLEAEMHGFALPAHLRSWRPWHVLLCFYYLPRKAVVVTVCIRRRMSRRHATTIIAFGATWNEADMTREQGWLTGCAGRLERNLSLPTTIARGHVLSRSGSERATETKHQPPIVLETCLRITCRTRFLQRPCPTPGVVSVVLTQHWWINVWICS